MTARASHSGNLRVIIAGGGVAALETAMSMRAAIQKAHFLHCREDSAENQITNFLVWTALDWRTFCMLGATLDCI